MTVIPVKMAEPI